jgi:hypothetical protein
MSSALLTVVIFISLFLVLPRETPVDKNGGIDYVGSILGLGGLILFGFVWKYVQFSWPQRKQELTVTAKHHPSAGKNHTRLPY